VEDGPVAKQRIGQRERQPQLHLRLVQ